VPFLSNIVQCLTYSECLVTYIVYFAVRFVVCGPTYISNEATDVTSFVPSWQIVSDGVMTRLINHINVLQL